MSAFDTAPEADVASPDAATAQSENAEVVTSIKGFDADLRCRGYQFTLGGTFTHVGPVEACESGFHAIEGHPLEVFCYYSPAGSRYAEVRQSGELSRHNGDSKLASAKISIGVELTIGDLVARTFKWVWDRCKLEGEVATGYQGAASSTGNQGAASSTGNRGAASSTGNQGAASSTGNQGAASSTGDRGAASSTGKASCAAAFGYQGRAKAAAGCAIFLVCRDDDMNIVAARGSKVGENGVEADTWYELSAAGEFVKAEPV